MFGRKEDKGTRGNTIPSALGELIIEVETPNFTGEVVDRKNGYCFLANVRRGTETMETNGDVFLHDPDKLFNPGDVVEFDELNPNPEKEGRFRAEKARLIKKANALATPDSRAAVLAKVSEAHAYHTGAKQISPASKRKAAMCAPFRQILEQKFTKEATDQMDTDTQVLSAQEAAKDFLLRTFANLLPIIGEEAYTINNDMDQESENKKVNKACEAYSKQGMDGQVLALTEEYRKFTGIREAFTLMETNHILNLETVLPMKHLADFLIAAPVWYIYSNTRQEGPWAGYVPVYDDNSGETPKRHPEISWICQHIGHERFYHAYQIFNRRMRSLKTFDGRDIIPPNLMGILEAAKKTFDIVAILTPYHDVAMRDWNNADKWARNVDPYIIGMLDGLDFIFVLGRFSATGLFPNVTSMVADTMICLEQHKETLARFSPELLWYGPDGSNLLKPHQDHRGNSTLVEFAEEMLAAYEAGILFDWLRGEAEIKEDK